MFVVADDLNGSSQAPKRRVLLVVEDDHDSTSATGNLLLSHGYHVGVAHSFMEAEREISNCVPDVMLIDLRFGQEFGTELIREMQSRHPGILCILMTDYASMGSTIEALQAGAYDYLCKPFHSEALFFSALERCFERIELERRRVEAEAALRETRDELESRVEARTAQLVAANQHLVREIAAHKQGAERASRGVDPASVPRVQSTVGEGSTFSLEPTVIDARAAHRHEVGPEDEEQESAAHVVAAQCTVLYIEDEPANLTLMQEILRRRPATTLLDAPNAVLGVELARASLPDIILMDINLPGSDGFDALEALRLSERTSGIPIIAVTADAMPAQIQRGQEAGFEDYIVKPIDVARLNDALDRALQKGARRRSSSWAGRSKLAPAEA